MSLDPSGFLFHFRRDSDFLRMTFACCVMRNPAVIA